MAEEAKYSIVQEVGRGSYGVVYEAVANRTKRKVAVKRTRCHAPESAELALQEFRALQSVRRRHENVIQLEECVLQHGRAFQPLDGRRISWERGAWGGISGRNSQPGGQGGAGPEFPAESLPQKSRNQPAPEPQAFRQLGHTTRTRSGIFPAVPNPSFSPSPPSFQVADFGLSKVCQGKGNVNQQRFSSACGSNFYMAPEVWEGHYTAKADIFALGIIFWAMAERITFRDGDTEKELLGTYIRQGSELIPLGEALLENPGLKLQIPLRSQSSVPEDLCELLHHMLAFDPEERLDASQLEAQLRRISYGRKRRRSSS
ncbi:PDK1L kinase, partial [Machaerirhynchus nigripectus]|nr:PDK1L kinase [Machaerirhynchus nigripectus]